MTKSNIIYTDKFARGSLPFETRVNPREIPRRMALLREILTGAGELGTLIVFFGFLYFAFVIYMGAQA